MVIVHILQGSSQVGDEQRRPLRHLTSLGEAWQGATAFGYTSKNFIQELERGALDPWPACLCQRALQKLPFPGNHCPFNTGCRLDGICELHRPWTNPRSCPLRLK
jgi:hypothetical protein